MRKSQYSTRNKVEQNLFYKNYENRIYKNTTKALSRLGLFLIDSIITLCRNSNPNIDTEVYNIYQRSNVEATNYVLSVMETLNLQPQKLKLLEFVAKLNKIQTERQNNEGRVTFESVIVADSNIQKLTNAQVFSMGRETLCNFFCGYLINKTSHDNKKNISKKATTRTIKFANDEEKSSLINTKSTTETLEADDTDLNKMINKATTVVQFDSLSKKEELNNMITFEESTITKPTNQVDKNVSTSKTTIGIPEAFSIFFQTRKKYFDNNGDFQVMCEIEYTSKNKALLLILMKKFNKINEKDKIEFSNSVNIAITKTMRIRYHQRLSEHLYGRTPSKGLCAYMSQYQAFLRMLDNFNKPLSHVHEYFFDDNENKNETFLKALFECLDDAEEDKKEYIQVIFKYIPSMIDRFYELMNRIKGNVLKLL